MSLSAKASAVLVGHRGFPQKFPENSLPGIKAALDIGAPAIEIDVQASADCEPMVCHDVNLYRVSGQRLSVETRDAAELMQVSVHEPNRFGEQHLPSLLPHLQHVVALLTQYPGATLFVELKQEIFRRYSRHQFLQKVMPMLAPLQGRCVIISFDLECLRLVQQSFDYPVGWVLTRYSRAAHRALLEEPVDIAICDVRKLPPAPETLWQGPWQWFVYDVVEPHAVEGLLQRGVKYIETWDLAVFDRGQE